MEMDVAINRIARDLRMFKLTGEDNTEDVKFFLNLLWTAAWEARGKELTAHNEKRVIQFNKEGKKIAEYNSAIEAAKHLKCHRTVIDEAIVCGRITRKGHTWKHEEIKETI